MGRVDEVEDEELRDGANMTGHKLSCGYEEGGSLAGLPGSRGYVIVTRRKQNICILYEYSYIYVCGGQRLPTPGLFLRL